MRSCYETPIDIYRLSREYLEGRAAPALGRLDLGCPGRREIGTCFSPWPHEEHSVVGKVVSSLHNSLPHDNQEQNGKSGNGATCIEEVGLSAKAPS